MTELQREYDDTVKATLAETNAAAQKWARPEKASFVLVGDYSKIGPGLGELKLGEVVLLDTEGKPVTPSPANGTSDARDRRSPAAPS